MADIKDLIIIGSGPAGLCAAIYALRARLDTIIIERTGMGGGQITSTYEVDNYPGLPDISGMDLAKRMREHVDKLDGHFTNGDVASVTVDEESQLKSVTLTDGTSYLCRTIIIATGATHRKLNVPGETALTGMGVSYCATCDGAFFKDLTAAVVGGGDVALEDAIYLSKICRQVYIIHRRDTFRGAKILSENLLSLPNITPVYNSIVTDIQGKFEVGSIHLQNVVTKEISELPVDGVFIAVGNLPNSEIYKDLLATDDSGYIIADETGTTNIPGIFAAGDVRTKQLRQVISAASDGANAVMSVERYLQTHH